MQQLSIGVSGSHNGQRPAHVAMSSTRKPIYRASVSPGASAAAVPPLSSYQDAYQTVPNQAQSDNTAVGVLFGANSYRVFGKRILDVALVVLFAPTALLLIGLSALLLWCEGGSPFYRQARLGKGGTTFSILKLRTMVRDADQLLERHLAADPALRAEWDRTQKMKCDPRITRLGALLRKTSLDELPQLWNVLKGDMSLVGPRPMLPEQLALYGDAAHYFALRPGISGYWQVSKRNEGSFLSRVAMDADYDHNLSLTEDFKVLLRTVGAVVKRTGY